MKTFGEKVLNARAQLDISQAALAKMIGVSTRMILTYENTSKLPRKSTLIKLAKALNVSVDYLKNDKIDNYEVNKDTLKPQENRQLLGVKEIDIALQLNEVIFKSVLPQEIKDTYFENITKIYFSAKNELYKVNKN